MNTTTLVVISLWGAVNILNGHYDLGGNLFGALLLAGIVGKATKRKSDVFSK